MEPTQENPTSPLTNTTKTKKSGRRKGSKSRSLTTVDGGTVIFGTEPLFEHVESKAVVKRVNQLSIALAAIQEQLVALHMKYNGLRRQKDIDITEIATLARKGLNKNSIATLLGFQAGEFSKKPDFEDAFNIGRSELAVVVADRQMELLLTTKGPILPIFLGKNYLGQKDAPDTNVNVQVNVDFRGALKDKLMTFIKASDASEAVDAQFSEVKPQPQTETANEHDGE